MDRKRTREAYLTALFSDRFALFGSQFVAVLTLQRPFSTRKNEHSARFWHRFCARETRAAIGSVADRPGGPLVGPGHRLQRALDVAAHVCLRELAGNTNRIQDRCLVR